MSERVLIVGATSAIAEAVARSYAAEGARLFLLARNPRRLADMAADLRIRGAREVATGVFDATPQADYEATISAAWAAFDGLDAALIAHGSLPDQARCAESVAESLHQLDINAISVIGLLVPLSARMAAAGAGTIAVIGSVAGDRGRQSNYLYGAAKACVHTYLEGLDHRLRRRGVRVVTIKPGFVDTPMTAAFEKGPLWAQPERVARDIRRALRRGTPVCYTPWFWRWIMLIIRHLPRWIMHRTQL